MTNTIIKIEITAINVNTDESFEKYMNDDEIISEIVSKNLPIIKCLEPEFFNSKTQALTQDSKTLYNILPVENNKGFSFKIVLEVNLSLPLRLEHLKGSLINVNTESGVYDVVEHIEVHDGAKADSVAYKGQTCLSNHSYRKASEAALEQILRAEHVDIKYTRSIVYG